MRSPWKGILSSPSQHHDLLYDTSLKSTVAEKQKFHKKKFRLISGLKQYFATIEWKPMCARAYGKAAPA
jgi:hypothetical protein